MVLYPTLKKVVHKNPIKNVLDKIRGVERYTVELYSSFRLSKGDPIAYQVGEDEVDFRYQNAVITKVMDDVPLTHFYKLEVILQ
jgi:hypothetical protein